MRRILIAGALLLAGCQTLPANRPPPAASIWLTTADGSQKLARQPDVAARPLAGPAPALLVNPAERFQQVHGFGASITDASGELIGRLPAAQRRALLQELFGRGDGGLGLSLTRLTVGASDFSRTHYSYDDTPGNVPDPTLKHYSIAPAQTHVLPVTREALAINRELKVMISPWSAPAWMKTSRSLIKGRLDPVHYAPFAEYLARTIEEFGREGVPVSLLSIQNEPDFEPENYPGMRMSPAERAAVIGRHLGPLFEKRRIKTRILDWDHNWDKPEQPLGVLVDPVARRYVAGVAWHCYAGDVPAQDKVRAAYPDKDVWFTECSGGEWSPKFGETLGWLTSKLIIGSSNTWSRGTLLWNLALDPKHGPHNGGCGDCRGVVTIDPASGAITRNVEYYALGHASRFVRPGATRIGVALAATGVEATAFQNRDGGLVLLVYRAKGGGALRVAANGQAYDLSLPQGAVATLTWPPGRRR